MKKKKYRNQKWKLISGDDDNFKYFQDDRFQITFNAFTNRDWYNPKRGPFETLPQLYILPEIKETYLEEFLDEFNGLKIILN